ncbi:hypothetical protein TNCV_2618191 [Trichonephila clavipes]|nr:hypothetical protein TNCV_2618191 [Trichonephila clavipes]
MSRKAMGYSPDCRPPHNSRAKSYGLRKPSGQSIGSWQPCHEFKPSTTLKTRRIGQRCTLNVSRAETSSRWCDVVVRRGGTSSGVIHVT